jgi:hypothetical protein
VGRDADNRSIIRKGAPVMKRPAASFLLVSLGLVVVQPPPGYSMSAMVTNVASTDAAASSDPGVFVGKWAGHWSGAMSGTLVIERVDKNGRAKGLYSWGNNGSNRPGSVNVDGTIQNGTLNFVGGKWSYTFVFNQNGTLNGTRTGPERPATITMSRQ